MKTKFSLLFVLALFANLGCAMAHALWIETETSGKKGQEQQVKIYYGEYGEGMIEKVEDWYSDVKDFELWLIDPQGNKTQLETTASAAFFTASFTPNMDGVYRLQVGHSAKDLGGEYVYQFNTATQVWVGKAKETTLEGPKTDLALVMTSPDKGGLKNPLHFKVLFKGEAKEGVTVAVDGPTGWSKEYTTDANGEIEVETPWKGQYIVEAVDTEETSGEHFGAPYEFIWRCATQSIKK
ncbi:DUF4198 domain-containing protein [Echinicola rosea]|uniref:DUF4198 domain-containing protein n=1 Tax=Echinicola rosea TaxID=1807691 RepID=A0ABQ1V9E5_9BACT|nr:DUF4198 domain-containing protein [Echinicola rosea]GGF46189.1 hypothetical protein GCM10011339_38360 [Echinicola rosea]